jgi:hypothetical protein
MTRHMGVVKRRRVRPGQLQRLQSGQHGPLNLKPVIVFCRYMSRVVRWCAPIGDGIEHEACEHPEVSTRRSCATSWDSGTPMVSPP